MKIKVLGCSGAEMPNFRLPAFLIDERMLLDAGTISASLNENSQSKITHILITHAHLDHIRGIPPLADNMLVKNQKPKITLVGIKEVLNTLKENLLNNSIWPDFTSIPNPKEPVLRLKTIEIGKNYKINGYSIIAEKVTHSVPAVGYIIKDSKGKKLIYTGDTGPAIDLWKRANIEAQTTEINGAIIEVTFPNSMRDLAIKTGHLTPALLFDELKKLKQLPKKIFITHPKPQFSDIIVTELRSLNIKQITMLKEGKTYVI